MSETDRLLSQGLSAGYTGKTEFRNAQRGDFSVKSSQFSNETGKYIDQWVNGGGQELALLKTGEGKTRVYAGRTIPDEELAILGLTEDDVIGYLIRKVGELGALTRLNADCFPEADGNWLYSYRVRERLEDIGLVIGLEEIFYREKRVFAHGFAISPAKIKKHEL